MMKVLRKMIFLAAITVGFSLTATAQRQDDKKPPPKDPPKIRVEDKKDKPKDDKRDDRRNDNRRPAMAFIVTANEMEIV